MRARWVVAGAGLLGVAIALVRPRTGAVMGAVEGLADPQHESEGLIKTWPPPSTCP